MTTYFVSRHPGALTWAAAQHIRVDRVVPHLHLDDIQPGDTCIGTLPVNLAAQVCAAGARYVHLVLNVPETCAAESVPSNFSNWVPDCSHLTRATATQPMFD